MIDGTYMEMIVLSLGSALFIRRTLLRLRSSKSLFHTATTHLPLDHVFYLISQRIF